MKTNNKSFLYLINLLIYGFLFFIFHLASWSVTKQITSSEFMTFMTQIIFYTLLVAIYLRKKKEPALNYIFPLIITSLLYFITVVTFTDRSLTVEMLLLQLENYENNSSLEIYDEINLENYIDKRLSEQINSGFIKSTDGNYELTNTGQLAAKIYKLFTDFYR